MASCTDRVLLGEREGQVEPLPDPDAGQQQDPDAGQHRYTLQLGEDLAWQPAQEACQSMGGYLATITSAPEQALASAQLALTGIDRSWLGGSQIVGAQDFEWVTGELVSFINWSDVQPDDGINTCMAGRSDGLWTDRPCDTLYSYLCEFE